MCVERDLDQSNLKGAEGQEWESLLQEMRKGIVAKRDDWQKKLKSDQKRSSDTVILNFETHLPF